MARYQKGQSGNPKGRPKGSVSQRKIREAIQKDMPEIIASMLSLAKSGDTSAARLLLDRVLPPMKSGDTLVDIPLSGELTVDAKQVLQAIGSGLLTPDQGTKLLSGIGSLARVIEIDELVQRVAALEASNSPIVD